MCVRAPTDGILPEAVLRSEMRRAAFVRTLPFWYVRAPYWFYVRRTLRHNRSIEELHRAGKIVLPNDPGFSDFQFEGEQERL